MVYRTRQQPSRQERRKWPTRTRPQCLATLEKCRASTSRKLMKDFKLPGSISQRSWIAKEEYRSSDRGQSCRIRRLAGAGPSTGRICGIRSSGPSARRKERMPAPRAWTTASHAFETALSNMRELAEMAAKSQKEAFEVIRKRVEEKSGGPYCPRNRQVEYARIRIAAGERF